MHTIDANEGSRLTARDPILKKYLTLQAQEGASMSLAVGQIANLNIKSVTGAIIEVRGATRTQDVVVRSSGIYHAEQLLATQSTVEATIAGRAYVNTSNFAKLKATMGGTIEVHGNPENVEKIAKLGGKIKMY